jgi:aspartyl-tRNA(Asn)/glutamyl-tRNA(Gln) amidotransferase subunit A
MTNHLIDRLRANLRAAAIPATGEDIDGLLARGFLGTVAAFEQMLAEVDPSELPDYLDRSAPQSAGSTADHVYVPTSDDEHSIAGVSRRIHRRELSPVELTEQALARIAARDKHLNAFQLVLADQALMAARNAEAELLGGTYRGPLHGVPVAVKDLFDMVGTPTTAGSKVRADVLAARDATLVARLRAAGAVIVGKTRLPEFAYSPGSNNPHYGPTPNPHNPAFDSGGSSSGSAAAVADGMAYAALGSDTGGSIRIPAALCGIVGLKPTFGHLSLAGAVSLSWSLDHAGPLTRNVADAALLMAALGGADPRDRRVPLAVPAALPANLATSVRGLRIGVLSDDGAGLADVSDEVLEAWHSGVARLEAQGAQLVPIALPEIATLRIVNGSLLMMEAASYHLETLRTRLPELGNFLRQRILAAFFFDMPVHYIRGQQLRAALRRRCERIFATIDLLCTPSQPAIAPTLGVPASTAFTGPFNCLGWPAISLPAGHGSHSLPLALQLVAKPWDEATLLTASYAYEQTARGSI